MLKIGDTVKVIGKTIDGNGKEREYIPIGTICRILSMNYDKKEGLLVEIISEKGYSYSDSDYGFWYLACDVEKGHMEWVKDN